MSVWSKSFYLFIERFVKKMLYLRQVYFDKKSVKFREVSWVTCSKILFQRMLPRVLQKYFMKVKHFNLVYPWFLVSPGIDQMANIIDFMLI